MNIALHGSRKRDHAFEVALRGYGARHTRHVNTGQRGAGDEYAATYSDWGHWLAKLFEKDPRMIAGQYASRADFHTQTERLYLEPERTPGLAKEVHRCMTLHGVTKKVAIANCAALSHHSPWLLKRAIEGEI